MQLTYFSLENFRSFVKRTKIELRPITLLFGYNSNGKSAILRALPLIADSLQSNSYPTPLALNSSALRKGTFNDLLSRISGTQSLKIELGFSNYSISWSLQNLPEFKTHVVSNFIFKEMNNTLINLKWNPDILSSKPENNYNISEDKTVKVYFSGLLPKIDDKSLSAQLQKCHDIGMMTVQWLHAVREQPSRSYSFLGAAPESLTPNGADAAQVLAYNEMVLSYVSKWYEKNAHQRLSVMKEAEVFKLVLNPLDKPHSVNLADVGEGFIQVLPILVACGMAAAGKTQILAIEEPESHLHPRLHASLAEQFVELAKQSQPPICLLETHSENFLLGIQLAIAKGLISHNLVNVYWIEQFEDGQSSAELIQFDELARPLGHNFPRGVFSEDTEQARQLIDIRRKRSS